MIKLSSETKRVLLFMGLALLVRVWLALNTYLISTDSAAFLKMARALAEGKFSVALHFPYHPFYPALIANLYKLFNNFETAGVVISITLGVLTFIPLFYLGRDIFGTKIALATLFILAIHPFHVKETTDIITEGTYIFLFISAITLGWYGLKTNKTYLFPVMGLCGALAYLTRPEGICLPVVISFWTGIRIFKKLTLSQRFQIARQVIYLWLVFLIMVMPYIWFNKVETGQWTISRKSSVRTLIKQIDQSGSQINKAVPQAAPAYAERQVERWTRRYGKHPAAVWYMVNMMSYSYHPLVLACLLAGVIIAWRRRNAPLSGWLYLWSFCLIYLPPLYVNLVTTHHLSERYLLPGVVLTLFWAGIGFMALADWLNAKLAKSGQTLAGVLVLGVFLALALLVPVLGKARRADEIGRKMAGVWIKEQGINNPIIVSNMETIAYYAEGTHLPIRWGNYDEVIKFGRKNKAQFLAFREDELEERIPDFNRCFNPQKLELVYRYPDTPLPNPCQKILIYKIK